MLSINERLSRKSVTVRKRNFIANPYIIFFFENQIRCYGDGATDFHIRKMHEAGSNHICFLLISVDSVSKKDENYYLKICNYIEKIRW